MLMGKKSISEQTTIFQKKKKKHFHQTNEKIRNAKSTERIEEKKGNVDYLL